MGKGSLEAFGDGVNLSLVLYLTGIALSFVQPWLGFAVYATVAAMWLVPDTRIDSRLSQDHH